MIELSPNTALMIYLGLTLCSLIGIWVYHHLHVRKKKFMPAEKQLKVCEFCHYAYVDSAVKKVSQCPRCHFFN